MCRTVYLFRLVDWDSGQDVRVFAIVPTRVQFGSEIAEAFAGRGSASMPATTDPGLQLIAAAEAQQTDATTVFAACDLLGEIEVWRSFPDSEPKDWFRYLGIER